MAKPTTVKCKYCGKEVNKSIAYNPSPRQYYCNEQHYLSSLEKKKQKGNHSYKSAKGTDRRWYTDTLQDLYVNYYGWDKSRINWQCIMSQTKTIMENNKDLTYEEIIDIIAYEQFILGQNLICQESNYSPLSLVEYNILPYRQYKQECIDIENSIAEFDFSEEPKVIKKNNDNNKRKGKEIDLNEL